MIVTNFEKTFFYGTNCLFLAGALLRPPGALLLFLGRGAEVAGWWSACWWVVRGRGGIGARGRAAVALYYHAPLLPTHYYH